MENADSVERQIVLALRRIIRAVDRHSRALAQRYGVTGPQVIVLQELVRSGPLATGALARRVHLAQGTVSEILERLEAGGLVERRRSAKDHRRVESTATERAAAIVRSAPSILQDRFVDELGKLSDWERSFLLAALQRVAAMMQAESMDAAPLLTTGPAAASAKDTAEFLTEE